MTEWQSIFRVVRERAEEDAAWAAFFKRSLVVAAVCALAMAVIPAKAQASPGSRIDAYVSASMTAFVYTVRGCVERRDLACVLNTLNGYQESTLSMVALFRGLAISGPCKARAAHVEEQLGAAMHATYLLVSALNLQQTSSRSTWATVGRRAGTSAASALSYKKACL